MDELRNCPFCGHKAEIRSTGSRLSSQGVFYKEYKLWCPNCGCTKNNRITVSIDYSPIVGAIVDESELKRAIERWGQRV